MRRLLLLAALPIIVGALVLPVISAPRPPSRADAAARSLEAHSVDVELSVSANDAPRLRAVGHATMSPPSTAWSVGTIRIVVTRDGTRVRVDGEQVVLPPPEVMPFDDVPALLTRLATGDVEGVDVDVGSGGRIARIIARTADGRVELRLRAYR
jgi:hypothetical protein